jgi:flagellar biosynthesis/type III secretory pathway chaperone
MVTPVRIKAVLVEQANGYGLLLDLLQRERGCLLSLDAEQVQELSKEKDTLILRLALLEEERVRLVKRYAEEQGITGEVCLSSVAEASRDEEFHNLRLRLASMIQSISELNEYNRILAERSLSFARNAVGLLTSLGVRSATGRRTPAVSKEV